MTRDEAARVLRTLVKTHADKRKATSRVEVTEAVTHAVCDWLRRMGAATVERETPLRYELNGKPRNGRIDVTGVWASGARMAVEIDHQPKFRSFHKLSLLKQGGWKVAWVRWDEREVPTDASVPCVWVHAEAARHMPKDAPRKRLKLRVVTR